MSALSHTQAKAFYDRFGAKQDAQSFYEDRATRSLIQHADLASARHVFEFGCGTGRFAENLLTNHLPDSATYVGIDLSSTMVGLARERLARFGDRARIIQSGGASRTDLPDSSCDRFMSNYVLDLLSFEDIQAVIDEAHRILEPGGLLCLTGLTRGTTLPSRVTSWVAETIHAVGPSLLGGCRPVQLLDFVKGSAWQIAYIDVVTPFGVASQVLVAVKLGA